MTVVVWMLFTVVSVAGYGVRSIVGDPTHPGADHQLLQVVLALVDLSCSMTRVRWFAIHQLS